MGKLLNYFAKFSFTSYLIKEKQHTNEIRYEELNRIIEQKQELEDKLPSYKKEAARMEKLVADISTQLEQRPKIKDSDTFLCENLSPSEARKAQLKILDIVEAYDIANTVAQVQLDNMNRMYEKTQEPVQCTIHFKKGKITPNAAKKICEDFDIAQGEFEDAIYKGRALKASFSYIEAQILADQVANYGIKCKISMNSATARAKSIYEERDAEKEMRKIALTQRFFLGGLWFLFFAIAALFGAEVNDTAWGMFLFAIIGAIVIILLLTLLVKPIVILAGKIVNKTFDQQCRILIADMTIMAGSQLSEPCYQANEIMRTSLIKCLGTHIQNGNTLKAYVKTFLPEKILNGMLPIVIEQMKTGANFNEALWKAEQKIDREIEKRKAEERAIRREKEEREYRAAMLKSQLKTEAYAAQTAAAAQAAEKQAAYAASAISDVAGAIRDKASAIRGVAYELEKMRTDRYY